MVGGLISSKRNCAFCAAGMCVTRVLSEIAKVQSTHVGETPTTTACDEELRVHYYYVLHTTTYDESGGVVCCSMVSPFDY